MRLTFPGAATSMARLATLLVLLWTGVRPVRRLDVVLVQAIAERTGVELQQPGGLLFHSSAALQSPDQQVPLNAVDQTFQVEPLRRNKRSAGKGPCATAWVKSLFVGATTRTSTLIVRAPPIRRNSGSCSTRNNLTWMPDGASATSSRNSVPPSATSKSPSLLDTAPVKEPRI